MFQFFAGRVKVFAAFWTASALWRFSIRSRGAKAAEDCRSPRRFRGSAPTSAVQAPMLSEKRKEELPMNLKTRGLIANELRISGSWSQLTSKFWRCSLSMNRPKCRQVLDCASPLALFDLVGAQKRQRTAAVQDAFAAAHPRQRFRPQCFRKNEGGPP